MVCELKKEQVERGFYVARTSSHKSPPVLKSDWTGVEWHSRVEGLGQKQNSTPDTGISFGFTCSNSASLKNTLFLSIWLSVLLI